MSSSHTFMPFCDSFHPNPLWPSMSTMMLYSFFFHVLIFDSICGATLMLDLGQEIVIAFSKIIV